MPPRSSWKGFVKLSLVSVPVKGYTAHQTGSEIHLNQLHEECKSRIRYQKTCPIHGEVGNDQIVSGYEFAKGQYVVVDLEELQKLRRESDRSVNIDGFVPEDAVDPIYMSGKTYYLVPDGPVGQKPYALLRDGMLESHTHGVARVVIAGRENLVLLRPMDGLLTMTVLLYPSKLKEAGSFKDEVTETAVAREEKQLAETLIGASMIQDFDFASYKDEYTEKLSYLIQTKVEGREIVEVPRAEEPQIINLMEALKASVARAQGAGTAEPAEEKKPARKKMAGSTGRKAPARKKKSG